jgi:hypothetical protein
MRNESAEARARRLAGQARWRKANPGYHQKWRKAHPKVESKLGPDYYRQWRKAHPGYSSRYSEKNKARKALWRASPEGKAAQAALLASPEYKAKWAEIRATPEYKAKLAAYRVANRGKIKAGRAAYLASPKGKAYKERAKAKNLAYQLKPEVKAARNLRNKKRYAAIHTINISRRMSSAVRSSLRRYSDKNKSWNTKWIGLVGYTVAELCAHIERQFLPKMGWHNMPKWHVDHIVPLASFRYISETDPEFKAAWALTNLRPIWAAQNFKKHARREFLL